MTKAGSFKSYLEQGKKNAVKTLLEKAYLANRIAKISGGDQRKKLYRLKSRYLSTAIGLMPKMFLVDSRTVLDERNALLGITSNVGYRFHVRVKENPEESGSGFGRCRSDADLAA